MQVRTRFLFSITMCVVASMGAMTSQGAYSVTNGGFDAQDATVDNNPTVTPTGWFNASNDGNTFSDNILNVHSGSNGAISNAGGAAVGSWDANGLALGRDAPFGNDGTLEQAYIYQQIGTYAGEASLGITGFVYNRTNGNQPGNFDVSIYYTSPGGFTPALGNDVGNAGALVGAKQVFLQNTDFTIASGTTAQSAPWSHTVTFAGSGISNGAAVWLRIGDGGNPDGLLFDEPIIDNVRIAGCGFGDTNCDGVADLATDFVAIRNNFRKIGVTRTQGDVDGSGDADLLDYLQWRRAFVAGGGSAASIPSLNSVPEPTILALGAIAALGISIFALRQPRGKRLLLIALGSGILSCLSPGQASAIDDPWTAGTANWNVGSNWQNTVVPNIPQDDRPIVNNGGTAQITTAVPDVAGLIIGQNAGDTGTVAISTGTGKLNVLNSAAATGGGTVTVGGLGTGTLRMFGGTSTTVRPTLTAVDVSSGGNALDVIDLSDFARISAQTSFLRGTTSMTGPNVDFTATTTLIMEPTHTLVANITSPTAHSAIKSTGPMVAAGNLNASFTSQPAFGQAFNILDANILVGNFANFANVPVTGVTAPVLGEVYRVKRTTGGSQGQVLQLLRDKVLALQVDRDSGVVTIVNPLGGAINIDGYTIASASGSLKPGTGTGGGAWNSLTNQGFTGWGRDGSPTGNGFGELKNVGATDFTAISPSLGNAYDDGNAFFTNGIGANGQDLVFDYSTSAGEVIRGQVNYVGVGKTNSLLLTIDPTTGKAILKNDSPGTITIDGYSVLSSGGALVPGGFNDAATANLTSASPSATAISELAANPSNPLTIAGGTSFNLGNIFNTAAAQTGMSLEFTTAGVNRLFTGTVRFAAAVTGVQGDYNGNGVVDAADYVVWRDHLGQTFALPNEGTGQSPGVVDSADYTFWRSRFGATSGSGSSSVTGAAVPEPSSGSMLIVGCAFIGAVIGQRRK